MKKNVEAPADQAAASARRPRLTLARAAVLAVACAAGPFVYEGGLSLYAQWRTTMGTYTVVETPRLDRLREWSRTASEACGQWTSPFVGGSRWQASTAVPAAIGWAAVMGFVFLNKTR